jgi:hypothetical protein
MSISRVFEAGVSGVRRQFERADVAAAEVLQASTAPSTGDRVEISESARQAAETGQAHGAGLESAMIDLRLAKYLAVANVKVLETGDEVMRELTDIVKPSRG